MKITTIGDTHGRTVWKEIVEKNPGSHYIFTGDYVDPYKSEEISEEDAIENLFDIIDFKNENKNNVTLLIGNHDFHYMENAKFICSSRSKKYLFDLKEIFTSYKNIFQFAFQKNDYLFTHAGVSNGWFKQFYSILLRFGLNPNYSNLADVLNKIGNDSSYSFIFSTISDYRGGFSSYGSPIWADSDELFYPQCLKGFHQIVGHNKFLDIVKDGTAKASITFCDCLFNKTKGLNLNI